MSENGRWCPNSYLKNSGHARSSVRSPEVPGPFKRSGLFSSVEILVVPQPDVERGDARSRASKRQTPVYYVYIRSPKGRAIRKTVMKVPVESARFTATPIKSVLYGTRWVGGLGAPLHLNFPRSALNSCPRSLAPAIERRAVPLWLTKYLLIRHNCRNLRYRRAS